MTTRMVTAPPATVPDSEAVDDCVKNTRPDKPTHDERITYRAFRTPQVAPRLHDRATRSVSAGAVPRSTSNRSRPSV